MNSTADRHVERYLKRLDADLADLPRARRREIVDEIAEHIAEARADLPAESEAETRSLLERLGDPADIAAEARQRLDVPVARPGGRSRSRSSSSSSAGSCFWLAGSWGSRCSGRRLSGQRGTS